MTNRVAINGEAATEVEERVRTRMDQEDQNTPEESQEDQESPDTKGLHLLNYWYPICFVRDLPTAKPLAAQLFGEPLVIFRGAAQELVCLQDRCAHRSAPLSIGTLKNGVVECRYHGWQFGAEGKCVRIPSLPDDKIPKSVRITSYPCTEREGIVWVWLGEAEKCSLVSGFPEIAAEWRAPGWRTTDMPLDQEYSYWALIENLLDPGHLQFTHEGTQGKNVGSTDDSFPDLHEVVITSTRNQGGFQGEIHSTSTKKELRFKIIFDPPVTVRLEVVFPNGWLFFQMHYCVPLTEGRTRILLRSMRTWLKFLPDFVFHKSNLRILDQDKCILYAQKLRSDQGSSSWNYPTKADALAIRYRRWRDVVEPRSKPWFKGYLGSSLKKGGGVRRGALGTGKDEKKEIEDLPKCCGACDQNLQTIDDIWKEAPYLWPSSEVLKQPPGAFEILTAVGKVLYVGCQIFALAVTILYLSDRFSHD